MLVGAMQLGIGLLHQARPHLTPVNHNLKMLVSPRVPVVTLDKQELPIYGGEEVVHDDVHPGAVLPELEVEDAGVLLLIKPLHLKVGLRYIYAYIT